MVMMMIREMHRTVKKKKATSMETVLLPGDGDDKGNETACRKNKVRGKRNKP